MKKNILFLIMVSFMFACVPTKQFKEVNQKSNNLETERDDLMAENERLTVDNTEMRSKMDQVKKQIDEFVEDSIRNYELKENLNNEIASLRRKYDDLQSSHGALLQGNAQETRRLLGQLQTTQEDLQKKEDRLRELEANMNERRQDLNRLSAELEARNARLAELQNILNRKDSAVNALKESVNIENYEGLVKRATESGVITEEQATMVRMAQQASAKVIAVDEFPPKQGSDCFRKAAPLHLSRPD